MQDNIYDYIIAELIKASNGNAAGSSIASLAITSNIVSNAVVAGELYNDTSFTSYVSNLPVGWTVVAGSHVLLVSGYASETTSTVTATKAPLSILLASAGDTLTPSSSVDITDGTTTLTLAASLSITAYEKMFYGVKANSATPDTTSLLFDIATSAGFTLTSAYSLNRLIFALPSTVTQPTSIASPSGNLWIIAEDFTLYEAGGLKYYTLNWDTLFTEDEDRTFTFKY
jgi:hypothetical protein